MRAVVAQEGKTLKVEEKPVPKINSNEILLKVVAVGLNPTDWKHLEGTSKPGDIMGCDFVGKVVEFGADVPQDKVKKGETRWGFCRGGTNPERGAFAEFVAVEWDITGVVPSNITPQQAASIPIPFVTAVQALYYKLKLPQPPEKAEGKWILIWSGSTAVGQYAIQLAKLSGLKVATTASPARWETLKAYGADLLVDYKDPDVVKKLKEGTNDSIEYGLDCIAEKGSIQQAQQAFGPTGGHLITLLFDLSNPTRTDVQTEPTLAYTALGQDVSFGTTVFPSPPDDRALFVEWAQRSTAIFKEKKIKPLKVDVKGGLDDIQQALVLLKEGKHKNKIVINVAGGKSWWRELLSRVSSLVPGH